MTGKHFPLNENLQQLLGSPAAFIFFFSGILPFTLAFAIVKIRKPDSPKPSVILQVQTENQSTVWLIFATAVDFKQQSREPLEPYMSSSVAKKKKSFLNNL